MRIIRFLFFGGTAALLNVVLMYGLVDLLEWNSIVQRNLANVISVELSLLYSYAVYRLFVWNDLGTPFRESLSRQLLRYHGSAGAAIVTRWFLLFPILDLFGLNHLINTVIGALVSCFLNYALSSRYVFVPAETAGSTVGNQ
jgi:dolichol-phosphate mannosyltransferase